MLERGVAASEDEYVKAGAISSSSRSDSARPTRIWRPGRGSPMTTSCSRSSCAVTPKSNPISAASDNAHPQSTPVMSIRSIRQAQLMDILPLRGSSAPARPSIQIRRTRCRRVRGRRHLELAAPHRAAQAEATHEPLHGAAGDRVLLAIHLLPHLPRPVDLFVLVPDAADALAQALVALGARGPAIGTALSNLELVVDRRGDRQHLADRLDPELLPVAVDEADHHFARRSSSAFAKYADAKRRISLARRSSKFSRSSSCNRARSVVRPGRLPASRSPCLTQLRNVSGAQPIFYGAENTLLSKESLRSASSRHESRLCPTPPGR